MKKYFSILTVAFSTSLAALLQLSCCSANAQTTVTLNADGPGNTYELINSVLAPGYTAVENPECAHPSFGRHIAEVFDATLNKYVFEFYSHVAEDNDRCINFDRQRVEIKTYDQSPDHLIGTIGETVTYKWQFRLPPGFQPSSSFTHIHQVKAVGGDESNPIFTLTPRKGTPNKMELIYVGPDNVTNKVAIVNLSLFAGVWVEATETLSIGPNGTYSMVIKRLSDNVTMLSYSNNDIATIRPTNDFIRPKWGIYRSLNNPADLRDDSIRLGTISISEANVVLPVQLLSFNVVQQKDAVQLSWTTAQELNNRSFVIERSADGVHFVSIGEVKGAGNATTAHDYYFRDKAFIKGKNFYRLRMMDTGGNMLFSKVIYADISASNHLSLMIYPNPVKDFIRLVLPQNDLVSTAVVTNSAGKILITHRSKNTLISDEISKKITGLSPGLYFIRIHNDTDQFQAKFIKQ